MSQIPNYKSLYIFNFVKRIEWPIIEGQQNFYMTIIGDEETFKALQEVAKTKKIAERNLVVSQIKNLNQIEKADLIYVDYSKRKYLDALRKWINDKPILLITDYRNAKQSDINLLETNEGLEFLIRPDYINNKGLKISDQLINLAKKVD